MTELEIKHLQQLVEELKERIADLEYELNPWQAHEEDAVRR